MRKERSWLLILRTFAIGTAMLGIMYSCGTPKPKSNNFGITPNEYSLVRVATSPENVRVYMLVSSDCNCITARIAISEDGKSVSISNAK